MVVKSLVWGVVGLTRGTTEPASLKSGVIDVKLDMEGENVIIIVAFHVK